MMENLPAQRREDAAPSNSLVLAAISLADLARIGPVHLILSASVVQSLPIINNRQDARFSLFKMFWQTRCCQAVEY